MTYLKFVFGQCFFVTVLSLSIFGSAPYLTADQITTAANLGPWHQGSGGEYTMTPDAALAALLGNYSPFTRNQVAGEFNFQTFCIERNEYLPVGTTFDVTVNNITLLTGDPLTAGAAYLYERFATGQLDYNYADNPSGGRTIVGFADALMLQNALWYLMNPAMYGGQANNPYVVEATAAVGNPFLPDNGAHHVAVLNLWAQNQPHDWSHSFQDVLIYTGVPEPSVLALVSVAGLIALRRRVSASER